MSLNVPFSIHGNVPAMDMLLTQKCMKLSYWHLSLERVRILAKFFSEVQQVLLKLVPTFCFSLVAITRKLAAIKLTARRMLGFRQLAKQRLRESIGKADWLQIHTTMRGRYATGYFAYVTVFLSSSEKNEAMSTLPQACHFDVYYFKTLSN